jgi:ATP-dependent exoDNAse (exonuclease V) alpha subunit
MLQDTALALLSAGNSIFLTGEPGSGKTHVVNKYTAYLRAKQIPFAVTASTGIAATHISGMTIHAWSGIGVDRFLDEEEIKKRASKGYIAKRIKKARVLIIDEISMLDGRLLTLIETMCRVAKKSQLPFGGLQVVLVGDFFQLPPIAEKGQAVQYVFESAAWQRLQPKVCYLHEQYRQEDETFLQLLQALRQGKIDESHYDTLQNQVITEGEVPDTITKLYAHNVDVDKINQEELDALGGGKNRYQMKEKGPERIVAGLKRTCLSPEFLELKIGALVMFTKNNQPQGYVNGTQGTVVGFDAVSKLPIVKTKKGKKVSVTPLDWDLYDGEVLLATLTQLPLRLAWAMTIHKSQGVSLDSAAIDLSKVFEYGQGYVALSRVRTLAGLHLVGINNKALEVNPHIINRDTEFQQDSYREEQIYATQSEEVRKQQRENFVRITKSTQ